jgi:predicted RNA-binding protein associated with RNAse of E/G family
MVAFSPGQVIVHRNTRRGRISFARPVRVVSDDERGLLVWTAPGTPVQREITTDGRTLRGIPFAEWVTLGHRLVPATWDGPGMLMLFPPEADHSVWWFWRPDGTFGDWYVNLEERSVRWDDGDVAGHDVVDQDLDVVVAPDRSWRWKDEDEFTERLALPEHYWVTDEAAVRAEGLRVIKQAEAGEFPFDGTWVDFRPDPAWPMPAFPAGWDRPVVARA